MLRSNEHFSPLVHKITCAPYEKPLVWAWYEVENPSTSYQGSTLYAAPKRAFLRNGEQCTNFLKLMRKYSRIAPSSRERSAGRLRDHVRTVGRRWDDGAVRVVIPYYCKLKCKWNILNSHWFFFAAIFRMLKISISM